MATKVSALTQDTAPSSDDYVLAVDNATSTSKKVTMADLVRVAGLPTQSGNSGRYLTTNGSVPSWSSTAPLTSSDIGSLVQAYNANLTTWAGKTVPSGTVVGISDIQTLTNKTISGSSNTLTNVAISSLSATGTPSISTYLRGDGSWAVVTGSGSGDMVGPASATDNALARFDLTTGKLVQNSGLILDDTNTLIWGGDTNLYRSTTSLLKTDASLQVATNLTVGASKFVVTGSTGNAAITTSGTAEALTITSTSTGRGVYIAQNANTGTNLQTSGALVIDNTGNTDIGFQFYTNQGASQTYSPFLIYSANTAMNQPLIRLISTGTGGNTAMIRMDGTGPKLEFIETDQVAPAGKFALQVQGDIFRIEGRVAADNSFEDFIYLTRPAVAGGVGGGLGIGISPYGVEKLTIAAGTGAAPRIALGETTAPSATTGYGKLYVKSADHNLYYLNQAGLEARLGSAVTTSVIYVTTTGSDSNDGLTWATAKLTVAAAITALPASGGTVKLGPGGWTVTSASRTDTVSYSSGSTFNDTSAVVGDVGKYVLWANLGRVAQIASVVAGVSFTVDVLPTTHAATTAKIITPGLVLPEGVYLEGVGSNFNHQLTAGASTSQAVTQISDNGTGVAVLIQGANSVSGNSTRFGLSNLSVLGNSSNTYGLFVGNGAWLIDSHNLELSNHGIAGLGLDGNINSHNFDNLVLYGNGNALASTPTGGVITHPFNAGGSASCNLYNPFFTNNIGFGIADGDTGGAYGVILYSPQFNSQQTSAMTNSGTSMVLQSKNTGDGMAAVYGGWSETAGLYDIITSGYVTVSGMRMHSSHAYHWIVNGGVANAIGCTFEGATTATVNLTGGGAFTWNAIKSVDPVLYSGAPTTIPSIGTSATLFGNALTANGITNTGDFTVKDAATATKAMRFQTSAASLDVAFAGATNYISNWTNADFTGTQVFYMAFDTSGNFDAFKVWRFHDAPFGTTKLTIDPAGNAITLGDGVNIVADTTTGSKIGTSTSQKLAFFNATPIVRPTGDISTALVNLGLIASPAFPNEVPLAPSGSQTVTANYSAIVVRQYTIASGTKLTLGAGSRFKIT